MAQEIPQYFLLRSGTHYIVAQAIVAVKQEALSPAVGRAISDEFDGAISRIEAVELPSPGDPCDPCGDDGDGSVVMMARMVFMAGMKKKPPEE